MSIDTMVLRSAERFREMIPQDARYNLLPSEFKDKLYNADALVDFSRPLTGEREAMGYSLRAVATKGDYSRSITGTVEYLSTPRFNAAIPNYKTTQETIHELRYK